MYSRLKLYLKKLPVSWNGIGWKLKETMKLNSDIVYQYNQVWQVWMRWAMINKTNEMEINDEMNEMDFGIWNEWDEID